MSFDAIKSCKTKKRYDKVTAMFKLLELVKITHCKNPRTYFCNRCHGFHITKGN